MDLSVIIVNYRSWEKLRECLDVLSSSSGSKFSREVIIVDNNSDDGNLDNFKMLYPGFRFISSMINSGFASGCNMGAGESAGKQLLFLNPDTIAGEDAIDALTGQANMNPGNFIYSCRQTDDQGRESVACGEFLSPGKLTGPGRALIRLMRKSFTRKPDGLPQDLLMPDWVSGSVILISREFFNSLGGFDEDFWMYFEDMDLCKRARNGGGKVLYYTGFSIKHKHGGSSRTDMQTTALTKTEVLISKHLYVSKHFSKYTGFCSQVFLVAVNIISGTVGMVAGIFLFFIPKIFARIFIFLRLITYYKSAIRRRSWISPRAVCREEKSGR